jgi:hypothetical protein
MIVLGWCKHSSLDTIFGNRQDQSIKQQLIGNTTDQQAASQTQEDLHARFPFTT